MSTEFDIGAYLARIGLDGAPSADEEGLTAMHAAHVFSVPFENLDIMAGKGIDVAPAAIFDKLVTGRRGGYCFEQNGLFLRALNALGFDARPLLARVLLDPDNPSALTHQVCSVKIGPRLWLADVGFGGGTLRQPIPMELEQPSRQFSETYQLVLTEPFGATLQTMVDGDWKNSYAFTLDAVLDADIVLGNHYTSTSPDVHFTKSRFAHLAHPEGRTNLLEKELTIIRNGEREVSTLPDEAAFHAALKEHFGIEL